MLPVWDLEIAYKAPPGYAVVTAITTLVAELVEEGLSLPDAEERVKSVLGLPQSINLQPSNLCSLHPMIKPMVCSSSIKRPNWQTCSMKDHVIWK